MSSAMRAGAGPRNQRSFEMAEQRRAIGQSGEGIVCCLVLQPALLRAALADVAHEHGVQALSAEAHPAHGNLDGKHFARQRARIALAHFAMQRGQPCVRAIAREQRDELRKWLIDQFIGRARNMRRAAGFAVRMMPASSTHRIASVDDCTTLLSSASRRQCRRHARPRRAALRQKPRLESRLKRGRIIDCQTCNGLGHTWRTSP